MAGTGQADDPRLSRLRDMAGAAASGLRQAVSVLESAALRAGLLDFPVQPVRSRRALALCAIVYTVGLIVGLIVWKVVPK